jgi:hypothetical protein
MVCILTFSALVWGDDEGTENQPQIFADEREIKTRLAANAREVTRIQELLGQREKR